MRLIQSRWRDFMAAALLTILPPVVVAYFGIFGPQ